MVTLSIDICRLSQALADAAPQDKEQAAEALHAVLTQLDEHKEAHAFLVMLSAALDGNLPGGLC